MDWTLIIYVKNRRWNDWQLFQQEVHISDKDFLGKSFEETEYFSWLHLFLEINMFKIEHINHRESSVTKALKTIDSDIHFRVLHALEENPSITQRELSKYLGISLGGVNYCLKELIRVGHIKIENFI